MFSNHHLTIDMTTLYVENSLEVGDGMSRVASNRVVTYKGTLTPPSVGDRDASRSLTALPEPMQIARWRQAAEARMEMCVAEIDTRIVAGDDLTTAQRETVIGFMNWTRRSLSIFVSTGRISGVDGDQEMHHWEQEASRVFGLDEPEYLDRFLRIWLAVIHEAAASGRASLYALST